MAPISVCGQFLNYKLADHTQKHVHTHVRTKSHMEAGTLPKNRNEWFFSKSAGMISFCLQCNSLGCDSTPPWLANSWDISIKPIRSIHQTNGQSSLGIYQFCACTSKNLFNGGSDFQSTTRFQTWFFKNNGWLDPSFSLFLIGLKSEEVHSLFG